MLSDRDLVAALDQIEDFRALVNNAEKVVTTTKLLKRAKREKGGTLSPGERKQQSENAKRKKEIREKLQKFLAKIPVFMFATDFREEALKHVIESIDSDLFTRVTGLTVEDFRTLNSIGLFNAANMNAAIYQFRAFERASLEYADSSRHEHHEDRVGLWDETVDAAELSTS